MDHSTVGYRLHRAGVIVRRGGSRRNAQHVLDLRDQGMSMAAIAAEFEMSVRGLGPVLPVASGGACRPFSECRVEPNGSVAEGAGGRGVTRSVGERL